MSFINNLSLFPVVALNLGTTVTEDIKEKKVYKLTKHYFAVFCVKTPNRVYFIEGNDNVTIPKLSELIAKPCLDLCTSECDVPLPTAVINNLVNFLKDPTMEISGFYLYDLYANGFITSDYFASRIVGMLTPHLKANGISVESIDCDEVIKLAHKSQASKLGLSGDSLSLKDRLKAYVNIDSKPKTIKPVNVNGSITVNTDAIIVNDNESTIQRQDSQTSESLPALESFNSDVSDTVNVNLTTMSKKDLLSYAVKLGITGLSKTSTVEKLIDTITETLNDPARLVNTSIEGTLTMDNDDLYADLIDNSTGLETEKELITA